MVKTILYVLVILLLGGWVGFWVNKTITQIKPSTAAIATPTASNSASQIVRQESTIASQSAFLSTQQSVASLAASLSTLTITDTILNPPVVELPLGFDSK
jgi:cytoskeletal protein RodZ